jgi:hypothetical protein
MVVGRTSQRLIGRYEQRPTLIVPAVLNRLSNLANRLIWWLRPQKQCGISRSRAAQPEGQLFGQSSIAGVGRGGAHAENGERIDR